MKKVAQKLGVSVQSIRRAYWKGDIPAYRICKMLRFDLERVQRIFLAKGLPVIVRGIRRAIGGASRQRAAKNRPWMVKRGRSWQMVGQEIFIKEPGF